MDFEKECMMFAMREPFYGVLLSAMERMPVTTGPIKTIAVSRSGNVFRLLYNPKFVESLPTDTVQMLILHEVLHLAMNHFTVFDEPTADPHERDLRNVAADLEVNGYLDRNKLDEKIGGVFAEDFGWKKHLGARQYLRLLKDKEEKDREEARRRQRREAERDQDGEPDNGSDTGDNTPGQDEPEDPEDDSADAPGNDDSSQESPPEDDGGGEEQPESTDDTAEDDLSSPSPMEGFDDHSMWPDEDGSSASIQEVTQAIESLLDFAAEQVEKGHGSIPGEMMGRIDKIRRKPKPAADWKRLFRSYLGREHSQYTKKSRKRLSRRFPDAPGNRRIRKPHILVAIDTSGSVSMPEYREFFGQILSMKDSVSFHVVECDATIQHEYDFDGTVPEVLHGGGGTSFQPVVDHYNQNRRRYDALVYFTDGYGDIPDDTPRQTLWVISSDGDRDRERYLKNGASVVFIDKKKYNDNKHDRHGSGETPDQLHD